MYRLIEFLRRFGNVLLFLLLETIALVLIINLNSHHQEISQGIFLQMSGRVNEMESSIAAYFNLSEENEKLIQENIAMRKRMLQLENELNTYKYRVPYNPDFIRLPDSIIPENYWDFIPCRVVNNSVNNTYNYITVNKGLRHGVKPGMGVLSPEGIAGRIIEVSHDYSLAVSVLNTKFRMSAKILPNNIAGSLFWDGGSPEFGILEHIPQTSVIELNDTVVTTSYGTTFPENCVVGTVAGIMNAQKDGFFRIKIRFSTNFRSIDNLYLIDNSAQPEIDSLMNKVQPGKTP